MHWTPMDISGSFMYVNRAEYLNQSGSAVGEEFCFPNWNSVTFPNLVIQVSAFYLLA